MFAGNGTPLTAAGADRAPAGTSPLLILTNDRQYTIAAALGADTTESAADVSATQTAGVYVSAPLQLHVLCFATSCT